MGFYSPRGPEVRICDGRDLFCPGEAISKLLEKLNVSQRRSEIEAPCGCLPSCTTLQYEVEISNLPWDFEAFARALGAPTEVFDV